MVTAYEAMMKAAAAHFDDNPRVEGVILQESSLSLNGDYSQDVGDGGTYTPAGWRDALIEIIDQCAAAFRLEPLRAVPQFPARRPVVPARYLGRDLGGARQPRVHFGAGPAAEQSVALRWQ